MADAALPERLTLDEAFRAAYFMVDQYVARERNPDDGLVLLWACMTTDPARWSDWIDSVRRALSDEDADQAWLHD